MTKRQSDGLTEGATTGKKGFTVSDMPARERPRERLMREGPKALTREEVLAVIISRGTSGRSVLDIARDLVREFKTIPAIADAPVAELMRVKGIGKAKACQIKAALELARRLEEPRDPDEGTDLSSAQAVFDLMRAEVADEKRECFFVLAVDSRNRLVFRDDVSVGCLNSTLAHPREVFEKAIRAKASGVIVVHNHPSGDPQPSDDDIRLTRRLAEAGKIMGIPLQDHIIVAGKHMYSFRARCLL
ncbi:MAG: DNA repair protein RadC [candidate division WOR-3 bacterium]|nr:MAG: DNA repair protein RadC [candidate division WOR-3 bacterium]